MTSPQDPNQPVSGEQPGAPPPWGAPPAGGLPQNPPPGWGAPPPAGQPQPGWGQPQPGWGQPGQPPSRGRRNGCLIAFIVVVAIIGVLVVGCGILVAPLVSMDLKLKNDLGNRADSVSFNYTNGQTTWVIHVAQGHEAEAKDMACNVVRPDLAGSQYSSNGFELVDSQGYILADESTPCN